MRVRKGLLTSAGQFLYSDALNEQANLSSLESTGLERRAFSSPKPAAAPPGIAAKR
jgi:hypothetical protein